MDHEGTKTLKARSNKLSRIVVDAAVEVHRELGPGLLESAYEFALCHELSLRDIPYKRQIDLNATYKGATLGPAYRLDILVDDLIILELKAVAKIDPIHEAQLLSYLKLTRKWLGFILNFNVPVMKQGIRRMVNGYAA